MNRICVCACAFTGCFFFFFSSRRRHTRCLSDWSSDVCSSDLYYHEPGHESEVRVELTSGSYTPEFRYAAAGPRTLVLAEPPVRTKLVAQVRQWVKRRWVLLAVSAAAVSVLGIGAAELRGTPSAVENFWNPVWGSSDSVIDRK